MKENLMISTSWYGESQHLLILIGFCDFGSTEKPRTQQKQQITTNCNHNMHKNSMKWLVQSNLQVILVIQWMYHYDRRNFRQNDTKSNHVDKLPARCLMNQFYRILGSPNSSGSLYNCPWDQQEEEGWSMSIHKVWSWIWKTIVLLGEVQGLVTNLKFWWIFYYHFGGILGFPLLKSPQIGGSLGSCPCWVYHHNPPRTPPCPHLSWLPSSYVSDLLWNHSHLRWSKNHRKPQQKPMSRYSFWKTTQIRRWTWKMVVFVCFGGALNYIPRMCNLHWKTIKMHQDPYRKNSDVYCIISHNNIL